MANRFRNPMMRQMYDGCIASARNPDSEFYVTPGGRRIVDKHGRNRRTGASHRCYFWQGFDGAPVNFDAYARTTLAYAAYRAGQDYRAEITD